MGIYNTISFTWMGPKFVGFTMYERIRKLTTRDTHIRLLICLEVWGEKRVEEMRVVGRKVEENGYPPHCLNVFKIK